MQLQGERFLYHGQEAVQAVYAPPHVIRSCLPLLLTLGSPSRPSSGTTARPPSANPRPPLAFSSAKSKVSACPGIGSSLTLLPRSLLAARGHRSPLLLRAGSAFTGQEACGLH